jgi:hypothetical protein
MTKMVKLQEVENKYKELDVLMFSLKKFIENFIYKNEVLADKFDKIRSNQQATLELMVGQASKSISVDVGDERLSDIDVAVTRFSPHELVRRATAKKLARKLLQKYHPDKSETGSAEIFNIIRRASKEGDVELINLYLHKEGFAADSLDSVYASISSRVERLKGTPLMLCARMFMANSVDTLLRTNTTLDNIIYTSSPFKENR